MRYIINCILFLVILQPLAAQETPEYEVMRDPEAKKILDRVSEKNEAYETIKAIFTYTIEDNQNQTEDTFDGTIFMKDQQYKVFLMGNEVFYNGEFMATLNVEAQEVTYVIPDFDDENAINPADLFSIYEKDFKYLYWGDETEDGTTYQVIELYPIEIDGKKYSKIQLRITPEFQIHSIKYFGKNGVHYIIEMQEIKPDIVINDQLFTFNEERHPDVEIIDLRQ